MCFYRQSIDKFFQRPSRERTDPSLPKPSLHIRRAAVLGHERRGHPFLPILLAIITAVLDDGTLHADRRRAVLVHGHVPSRAGNRSVLRLKRLVAPRGVLVHKAALRDAVGELRLSQLAVVLTVGGTRAEGIHRLNAVVPDDARAAHRGDGGDVGPVPADPPAAGMSEPAFVTICLRGDCDTSAAKGARYVACISAGSREWVAFSLSASISRLQDGPGSSQRQR